MWHFKSIIFTARYQTIFLGIFSVNVFSLSPQDPRSRIPVEEELWNFTVDKFVAKFESLCDCGASHLRTGNLSKQLKSIKSGNIELAGKSLKSAQCCWNCWYVPLLIRSQCKSGPSWPYFYWPINPTDSTAQFNWFKAWRD